MPQSSWKLTTNPLWTPCAAPIPQVEASLARTLNALEIHWTVVESHATFRTEVLQDGGPCWQDSCVELFVEALDGSGNYCNFEFSASGACLAAVGPDRLHRQMRSDSEYASILRKSSPCELLGNSGLLRWELRATIPLILLGSDRGQLRGNLYKCGDLTQSPHWLSAFPIDTPKPDFHRPEYFQALEGLMAC